MSHYTRLVVPGGTYFFTVRLQDRGSRLLTDQVDLLRSSVRLAQKRWPFVIAAAVVLPDHLHMIWTLPQNDPDFSKRWRIGPRDLAAPLARPLIHPANSPGLMHVHRRDRRPARDARAVASSGGACSTISASSST